MMQLGLTIPLMRQLKIKSLPYGQPPERRYAWDLHCITLHGRSALLAVHCSSRYTFTLFDMTPADWESLTEAFLRGLGSSLSAAGISETEIARYLQQADTVRLTKTHGRREVAFLNRAWEDVVALDYAVDPTRQCQPLLDGAVNALPRRCAGYEGMAAAGERIKAELKTTGDR